MEYDLSKEISLKCLHCIEKIASDYDSGRITDGEYSYAHNMLWDAFSGLVGHDLTEIMTYMVKPALNDHRALKTVLTKDSNVVVIENDYEGCVKVNVFDAITGERRHSRFDMSEETRPHLMALEKYESLIDKFKQANYKTLE